MSGLWLLLQLVFGLAVVLAPGALLARTLGVRGVSSTLGWGLALVFAALAVTFAVHGSLTPRVRPHPASSVSTSPEPSHEAASR